MFMKGILVLLIGSISFFAGAQERAEGEGKAYELTLSEGKSAEILVYVATKKKDTVWVECQIKDLDVMTPFRFWQSFEWKILKYGKGELVSGYVFSPEMQRPQKFLAKDLPKGKGISLTADLLFPLMSLEAKKGDYELRFKEQVKNRPTIINPSKADPLDEKGIETLNFSYSCR